MKYDPSSLKWGVSDKSNDRLIAAFDDQSTAQTFHSTISNQGQFSGRTLQVIDLKTGQPVSERELAGDNVG